MAVKLHRAQAIDTHTMSSHGNTRDIITVVGSAILDTSAFTHNGSPYIAVRETLGSDIYQELIDMVRDTGDMTAEARWRHVLDLSRQMARKETIDASKVEP
jgi:hypothetical protein